MIKSAEVVNASLIFFGKEEEVSFLQEDLKGER